MSQAGSLNGGGGGGGSVVTINGDTGSVTGPTVAIYTNNATNNSGATFKFDNSGTVSTLNVTDVNNNTYFGKNAGNTSSAGVNNAGFGTNALFSISSGVGNLAIGPQTMSAVSTQSLNTAIGQASMINATGGSNTALGQATAQSLTGSANVAIGTNSMVTANGNNNVACGFGSLSSNTGDNNVAVGTSVLITPATTFTNNCAVGSFAAQKMTGSSNTCLGIQALANVVSGTTMIGIGYQAGFNYVTTDTNCIVIGNSGTAGNSNEIVIGNTQTTCFIKGISGVTVTGAAVLCSAAGQLGTVPSSERYKENIVDMPENISVLDLRPVSFVYKNDESKSVQYGLIAEEVDKNFPYLCLYKDGQPETVKYHELCTFLLAEIQRLNKRVQLLEK